MTETQSGNHVRKSADAFRTISEVADFLEVPQHVLRFWETKFSQVKPMKRAGGRRYYRPDDVELLRCIRDLLYNDGYTIRGVQKLIRGNGVRKLVEGEFGGQLVAEPSLEECAETSPKQQSDMFTTKQVKGNGSASNSLAKIHSDLLSIRQSLVD